MSIASKLNTLNNLYQRIQTKLRSLGLMSVSDEGLSDCADAIEDINGTRLITDTRTFDVAAYQYARVDDDDLAPNNIVRGVTILGVTGTAGVTPQPVNLVVGTSYYGGSGAPSSIYPPSGADGFSRVDFELTDANPMLKPSNIRYGITVMGVSGNLHRLQTKSVTLGGSMPSSESPTRPYDGISQVSFSLDSDVVKSENIKNGVDILGVTGSYETPTESKMVRVGADNLPGSVLPSAGKHLSLVSFSVDWSLIKAENIRDGVTILGVQGTLHGYNVYHIEALVQGNGTNTVSVRVPNDLVNRNQIMALNVLQNNSISATAYNVSLILSVSLPSTYEGDSLYLQTSKVYDGGTPHEVNIYPFSYYQTSYITISGSYLVISMPIGIFVNTAYYHVFITYRVNN